MKELTLLALLSLTAIAASGQQEKAAFCPPVNYLLHIPDSDPPAEGYPLLMFLHGSGERGDSLALVRKHGPPSFLDERTDFPFVVISPQARPGFRWNTENLLGLLDHVMQELPIDPDRVSVTGLSMGGQGTWDLALAAPDRFAAVAPVCGFTDTTSACRLRYLPSWVFHGDEDTVVPPEESIDMVKALLEQGAPVRFTLYQGVGHDAWVPAYQNEDLYDWLLRQRRATTRSLAMPADTDRLTGSWLLPGTTDTLQITSRGGQLYASHSGIEGQERLHHLGDYHFRAEGRPLEEFVLFFNLPEKGKATTLTFGLCRQLVFLPAE